MIRFVAMVACTDPNRTPQTENDVAWEECPLQVDGRGPPTQCATVELPLWWDDPDGAAITSFAQRHLATGGASRILWMLPGGPGQTGAVYEGYVKDLARALPDTDVYLFEHRGVGRSTRLGCPDQEDPTSDGGVDVSDDEWAACLDAVVSEWGDDLAAFSSAAAADDLAEWIRLTANGREVFVYGGSYGTTLAHRFLQRHPDLADGVVLDSIAIDVDHRVYDAEYDDVARGLLDLCAADERCAESLGDDPEATALDAVAFVDAGGCDAVDGETLRAGVGSFAADATLRGFAPALLARAGRCNDDDASDIARLIDLFVNRDPHYTETLYSPVLFRNIELSEQWPEPWPTQEELEEAHHAAIFSVGLGPSSRPLLDLWPRYPWSPEDNALAVTDTPLLMLQGGLDPQTPLARTAEVQAHFSGDGQHFVLFPQGAHILLGSTPGRGGDCATRLLEAFLDDPYAAPDASCVDTVDPVDFDGQPLASALLMGGCSRYGKGCGGRKAGAAVGLVGLAVAWRRRRV
jgi:pimeloyl-ACP methyl ester carboxylesterase